MIDIIQTKRVRLVFYRVRQRAIKEKRLNNLLRKWGRYKGEDGLKENIGHSKNVLKNVKRFSNTCKLIIITILCNKTYNDTNDNIYVLYKKGGK